MNTRNQTPQTEENLKATYLCRQALGAIACVAAGTAIAQGSVNYPSKPVMMVLPFPPGGSPEIAARKFADKLGQSMGKPFLVDFKPGAGTGIASGFVARSQPDGHTLLYVTNSFTILPAVSDNTPYDAMKDFDPIVLLSKQPSFLLVNNKLPINNFKQYLAYAKAHPGELNYGMIGVGGGNHLSGAWLHFMTDTKVTYVPYKGSTLPGLMSGEIQVSTATISAALSLVRSGKIRAIANTDAVRSPALPDVPTLTEQGLPGYEFAPWQGWLAPAGIPAAIARKLESEFVAALNSPDINDILVKSGTVPIGAGGAQFRKMLQAELARWAKVAKDANIRVADQG